MGDNAAYLWWNGETVPWEKAMIHVVNINLPVVQFVFEGIKAYRNPESGQMAIFRLPEHMRRFADSMKINGLKSKWSSAELIEATRALLVTNEVQDDTRIRPVAYFRMDRVTGFSAGDLTTDIYIVTDPFKSHLLTSKGVSAGISSWTRISDRDIPPRVKSGANYHNSRLALREAKQNGYDEAILLNSRGTVAEGGGACIFVVREGEIATPNVTSGILESVTRRTLIQLFKDELGRQVTEREVDRTELYVADECFFCGTGYEITPIVSVDRFPVGDGQIGPVTRQIAQLYHDVVRGLVPPYSKWLTPVS